MRKQLAKFAAFGLALSLALGCLEDKGGGSAAISQGSCSNAATSDNIVYCGGQTYKTVKIGRQVWMAQNLNYDVPDNATDICYANIPANCAKYGRLYSWATAMALPLKCNTTHSKNDKDCAIKIPYHQGICPVGWHVPSEAEWNVLFTYGINNLKAKSGWKDYVDDPCNYGHERDPKCKKKSVIRSGNGTDKHGFNALPDGSGSAVTWWSSTEYSDNDAMHQSITASNYVEYNEAAKSRFFYVRCLKD